MGVPVQVHFTFVLLLVFLALMGVGGNQPPGYYGLFLLALLASVLLHEFGHALATSCCGLKTLEIVMFPIGGVARLDRPAKPRQEFWIAAAGPLVNLAIAGAIFALLYSKYHGVNLSALSEPGGESLADRIALGNLVLAGFNLLPAFPMDGGHMLRAALSRSRPEYEATRLATWSGRVLAISMALYGLVNMPMLALVAFFVFLGADSEGIAARRRSLAQAVPVKAAMLREYRSLSHGSTLREAADLLLATSQQDFPILHGDQVIGLLGRNALLRGLAAAGPDSYVAQFMDREFASVSPDAQLSDVLQLITHPGACVLVVEDGRPLGLLGYENLSHFLVLRSAGLRPVER